jgi:hypothetical protein
MIVVGTVVDADAVAAAADESMLDLAGVYVLPQATLRELADRGVILSVMTFEEHMSPQVHWIEPEEFGRAFEELTNGDKIMEAAFTPPGSPYPPFINAKCGDAPDTIAITVRSPQKPAILGDTDGSSGGCGEAGRIEMDLQDFDQWLADLQRLRAALG